MWTFELSIPRCEPSYVTDHAEVTFIFQLGLNSPTARLVRIKVVTGWKAPGTLQARQQSRHSVHTRALPLPALSVLARTHL